MSKSKLDLEKNILVKESRSIKFIAGGVLLAVFFMFMLFDVYGWINYLMSLCMFLIPGAIAIAKGRRNAVKIKINKTGFYYGGKLVNGWKLFYDAVVKDKKAIGSYRDNFILEIRYYSSDYS